MTDDSSKKSSGARRDAILDDEKETARSKRARSESDESAAPLADALAVGGGQQSSPFQLATQADAIAKQSKRNKN